VTDGLLVSDVSDWGLAGAADNLPDDVYVEGDILNGDDPASYLGYDTDEDFACDIYACSPLP
jgi:hypothetical protein